MRVIVYTDNILKNIEKAQTLSNVPISLMFKDFYEDTYYEIGAVYNKIFGKHIHGSTCYSIGEASYVNCASIVTSLDDAKKFLFREGIRQFYIPINAHDDREGLQLSDVRMLAHSLSSIAKDVHIHGMITSGCLNEKHPTIEDLRNVWDTLRDYIEDISLGGSFWLGQNVQFPPFVSDIRIGEYMLFGTIPYCNDMSKNGFNGISIQANVIGVYLERKQLIIDCGYSMADMDKCKFDKGLDLTFVDSSSEYTIMRSDRICDFKVGDTIALTPNYKSLVKLRYADHEYRKTMD